MTFSTSSFNDFVHEYYLFGKKLAKKNLKTGIKKFGCLKAYSKVFNPVTDWSRFSEFYLTKEILMTNLTDGDKVLDIGSPKLFPIWLSTKKELNIVATDLWDFAVSEYSHFWESLKNKLHSTIHFEQANLLDLKFADNEFDAIFSISTIEHASHENWKEVISKNFARILKKGKILVVTTPFGSKSILQFKQKHEYSPDVANKHKNFFMRIINEQELNDFLKIAESNGLHLEKCYTVNIKANKKGLMIRRFPVYFRVLLGFLKPKLAIQNFLVKEGLHFAENENYDQKWMPDMITSDIVLIFRKK